MERGRLRWRCLLLWDCSPLVTFVAPSLPRDGSGTRVFWRVAIWARSWSFVRFISFRSRATLSHSYSACPHSWTNKACCFVNFSFMSANIWRVGLRKLTVGGYLRLPPAKTRRISFTMGLRLLGGIMSPAVATNLPLEVFSRWWSTIF